jgi:hypothetical protein
MGQQSSLTLVKWDSKVRCANGFPSSERLLTNRINA